MKYRLMAKYQQVDYLYFDKMIKFSNPPSAFEGIFVSATIKSIEIPTPILSKPGYRQP